MILKLYCLYWVFPSLEHQHSDNWQSKSVTNDAHFTDALNCFRKGQIGEWRLRRLGSGSFLYFIRGHGVPPLFPIDCFSVGMDSPARRLELDRVFEKEHSIDSHPRQEDDFKTNRQWGKCEDRGLHHHLSGMLIMSYCGHDTITENSNWWFRRQPTWEITFRWRIPAWQSQQHHWLWILWIAFICNLALISPHQVHFNVICTCNLMITSQINGHTYISGWSKGWLFSLLYSPHYGEKLGRLCLSLALLTEQVGQTCVLLGRSKI